MIIPTYVEGPIVDEEKIPVAAFQIFLHQLLQNLQLSVSDEGYLIPSISSQPGSAMNPANPSQTELDVLIASFLGTIYYPQNVSPNAQTVTVGVQSGTLIFDPYELNGGIIGPPYQPLGQLKIILNDGSVHSIANS